MHDDAECDVAADSQTKRENDPFSHQRAWVMILVQVEKRPEEEAKGYTPASWLTRFLSL